MLSRRLHGHSQHVLRYFGKRLLRLARRAIGAMFAQAVKVPGCAFLNSFIPDAIGTVRVTPAAHIKNRKVSPKITSPALNPEEKRF
jgi:hypothetical protein